MSGASEGMPSKRLRFWDCIAAGLGLAMVPLVVHFTPSHDLELLPRRLELGTWPALSPE